MRACVLYLCLSFAVSCFAGVVTYPVPDAVADSPYAVAVDGRRVPIEKAGEGSGAYYARFQFTGTVRAMVAVKPEGNAEFTLKPERFRDDVVAGPRDISFDVFRGGPRVIMASVGGRDLWPLIVIAEEYDAAAPPSSGSAVYNVRDYGVTSEGIQTARIQRALDDCAAAKGGGTVYFGPGVYHTGAIRVGDNTTVYLAPGALIVGSTDPADYPVDEGRVEQGTHGPVCSFSRLIFFDRCVNSKLCGYGVIDGMGHIVRNKHGRHVQLVDVTGCRSVRIENVVLRNSAEWTLHILASDRVFVDNLKIINDWDVANTDGINPDSSRNVYITRYFGFCGDDAVAVKTTGNLGLLRPASNIKVRGSVVMTRKTAYKIGTETYADIYDVLFEDCEVINSSRGIGLWMRDGSTISGVTFRDMKLDLREIAGEGMSGEPVRVTISDRRGVGGIRNVLFERVVSHAPYSSLFHGHPDSPLTNFTLSDCSFALAQRKLKMDRRPVVDVKHAVSFALCGVEVTGSEDQRELWDGIVVDGAPFEQ